MKSVLIMVSLLVLGACVAHVSDSPDRIALYDGHIHYDQDVWSRLPPDRAIAMLTRENITRALVSATPTVGTEKLYRENSHVVIPMLRPYKSSRHRYLWFKDPELRDYLLQHLARIPYRGFGEFHVFGKNADTKQIEDMIALARERGLVLHAHTDLEGMQIMLDKARDVSMLWAHGGFDVPIETLRKLLDEYPLLIIELSLREGMLDENEMLTEHWQQFLKRYHTRFIIGMDTYKPSRWAELPEIAAETRHWLNQLPDDIAADIARNNIDRLFPPLNRFD